MKWTVAAARQNFSKLLRSAKGEPQRIFNRDEEVAVLVDGKAFEEFSGWLAQRERQSIGDAFGLLRRVCQEEGYSLAVDSRKDRPNPFARRPR